VGGPADIFAVPADKDDLTELVRILGTLGIPWFVVGGGFNLLVRDGGFRGAAISLRKLDRIGFVSSLPDEVKSEVYAEAGATNRDMANFVLDNALSSLEFLIGIPGTIGGALCMNAGAHGGEIFDCVTTLETLGGGKLKKYRKNELNYGYRRLQLDSDEIIINAEFRLVPDSREKISATMASCLEKRRETQKVGYPNAGSFFKNPAGQAAWRLIDEAGLRGYSVGGAQVSEVHTNFLVNRGGATAMDFLKLATMVKEWVYAKSGVQLEEEIRIVGEN
jgi:UDP-N-acetylmuramate dehydrogenase